MIGSLLIANLVGVAYAAPLPDLHCDLDGLGEAVKGTVCFDPKQPWFICYTIENFHSLGNAPVGDAAPFTIKLEIMKGPKLDSGVFQTVTENISDGLGAGDTLGLCLKLPKNVDHKDLGTKRAFRLTVDPPLPNGIIPEDNETNNLCEYDKGTEVPMMPAPGVPPPPDPDKNVKIIDTAGIPGDTHNINVRVKNLGTIDSKVMVMFLTVRSSGFGAAKDASDDMNGIKVPSIPAGKSVWVKIGSVNEEFIQPTPKASKVLSEKNAQPLISKSVTGKTTIIVDMKKATKIGAQRRGPAVLAAVATPPDYKVLIPFTLEISGTHEKLSFGQPSRPTGGQVIKVPGKK